jgi:hypothetical protein
LIFLSSQQKNEDNNNQKNDKIELKKFINDNYVISLKEFIKDHKITNEQIYVKMKGKKYDKDIDVVYTVISSDEKNLLPISNALGNYGSKLFDRFFQWKNLIFIKKLFGDKKIITNILSTSKPSSVSVRIKEPVFGIVGAFNLTNEQFVSSFTCYDMYMFTEDIKKMFKEGKDIKTEINITITIVM